MMVSEKTLDKIRLFRSELLRQRRQVVSLFMLISLSAVVVGLNWPKNYISSTNMYVEYKNIIDPLMAGAAVRADIADLATNAREIIFGRSNLTEVLSQAGLLDTKVDSTRQDRLIADLKARIRTANTGTNMIRIEYRDQNPARAFAITRIIAEVLLQELRHAKMNESRAAFEFIDSQVREYENILGLIQTKIDALRAQDADAQPEFVELIKNRISQLTTEADQLGRELADTRIAQDTLRRQLAEEVQSYTVLEKINRDRTRLTELQTQLEQLRLDYRDNHPDIVRLNQQIAELQAALGVLESETQLSVDLALNYQSGVISSERLYQTLKENFYQSETRIKTLEKQLEENQQKLHAERDKMQIIRQSETAYNTLMSDYRIKESVYQDLLQRRERARVSSNIDAEQAALSSVRITEPAFMPQRPEGPGLPVIAAGGVALGLLLPLLVLVGKLLVDTRIRLPDSIQLTLELPLLEVIPHFDTPHERRKKRRGVVEWGLLVMLTLAFIVAVVISPELQRNLQSLEWLRQLSSFYE